MSPTKNVGLDGFHFVPAAPYHGRCTAPHEYPLSTPKRTVAVSRKAAAQPIFGPFTFRTQAVRAGGRIQRLYSGSLADFATESLHREVAEVADVGALIFLGRKLGFR